MSGRSAPAERLPPARLPWLWFLVAHLSLLAALGTLVAAPALFGDFYYHPRALALVHLVTLGWISGNIVGSLYLVGPVAMRRRLEGGWPGAVALALVAIGLSGMVAHFWIDSYPGMVWAAGTVLAGFLFLAPALMRAVAGFPRVSAVAIGLAFLNLIVAGCLGTAVGLEKMGALVVPGPVLASVHAHAHLAAVGWALMTVIGVGHRLLPMQLPSAIPPDRTSLAAIATIQTGLLALAAGLMGEHPGLARVGGLAAAAGVALFFGGIAWMLGNRRRPPSAAPRPDPAVLQTGHALLYLLAAALLGNALLWLPPSESALRLTFAYGVLGLVGFLAQIIVGVGGRLLPLAGWTGGFVRAGFRPPPTGLYEISGRAGPWGVLIGWVAGVPALVVGLAAAIPQLTRVGAGFLLLAALVDGYQRLRAWRLSTGSISDADAEPPAPV